MNCYRATINVGNANNVTTEQTKHIAARTLLDAAEEAGPTCTSITLLGPITLVRQSAGAKEDR